MIFRRSLQHVTSRESYLSGDAHPAAFEGATINPARMVSLAQSIEPDAIPPAGPHRRHRGGSRHRGRRLLRRRASPSSSSTRPAAIARIWRSKAGDADDDRLGGGDPRPERPAARLPLAPAPGRPGEGHDRAAPATAPARRSPSTGTTPSSSPTTTPIDHRPRRHRRLRLERRPRQRPGDPLLVLPPDREAPLRARPRTAPRASPRSTTPNPAPTPTPTRSSFPAPTGATTSPTTPAARLPGWTRVRGDRAARPEAFDADGRRLPDPRRPRRRGRGRSPIRSAATPTTAGSWSRRSMPPPSSGLLRRSM